MRIERFTSIISKVFTVKTSRQPFIRQLAEWTFRITLLIIAVFAGISWYQRTINIWAMKNIGDTFLTKDIGTRQIVLGAFHRPQSEQNIAGNFAIIHFLGDGRMEHPLYCLSLQEDNQYKVSRAHVQRIHRGKRTANDICSWSGHIAECEMGKNSNSVLISTTPKIEEAVLIDIESPVIQTMKEPLVVCVAPMYIYTDWEIMLIGIETWLALGATKIIIPIQSASTSTYKILKQYEKSGQVILRSWNKWPMLSDTNPNGLALSRGIEESHVNCLMYVKPWADLVVFTDIDDMLLPSDAAAVSKGVNLKILRNLFAEHPQAGSLLFEHRDVQFQLPTTSEKTSLAKFSFSFLTNSKSKMNCNVWRMKTRVVVNASRVDSVNMHETGLHRLGYVQTRIPCRQAHFYHLRHSHSTVENPTEIDMKPLSEMLNKQWDERLAQFTTFKDEILNKSSTESFEDFDRCMGAINAEHWTMKVSRCLTPHVCFSRLKRDVSCVAVAAAYEFFRSGAGYFIMPTNVTTGTSEQNCEAPTPTFVKGNHYFMP